MDWSLPSSTMKSGFSPMKIVDSVDFISAHLYPETGKPEDMIKTLRGFCVGKPVVIDETFQLKCSASEHEWFLQEAATIAQGFLGFYTDALPPDKDDGRNDAIRDCVAIFRKCAPLFIQRNFSGSD